MSHRLQLRVPLLAFLASLVALPLPAHGDDDQATSIFTDTGYELRRDDRIFTLFAALNVAGYDAGERVRTRPFPRYAYHPLRQRVRDALASSADKLRAPVDRFLDGHQQALNTYVSATLTLAPNANFTASDGTPATLNGLDSMLAAFAANARTIKLSKSMADDYRNLFKQLRPLVDGPFSRLRAAYRLNEDNAPSLILVPNPLDAPGTAVARKSADGSHFVVFGVPAHAGRIDLKPALRAYSELLAQEATADVSVAGLDDVLQQLRAKGRGVRGVDAENMVRESLRIAIESKLWSKTSQADVDAAFQRGFLYGPAFLKALTAPAAAFPASKGSFAAQVVASVDLHKTLTDLDKTPTVSH